MTRAVPPGFNSDVVVEAVLSIGRIEVAARGHEVRRVALPGGVHVNAVHARRQTLEASTDLYAAGHLSKSCRPNGCAINLQHRGGGRACWLRETD
jgi:hypothetical protein